MNVLGLDIGGANIKACDLDGSSWSLPFAMWQRHEELTACLVEKFADQHPQLIGLTMTAELADCFQSKDDGVRHVVESVSSAFPEAAVRVWMTSFEFAEPQQAIEFPMLVAAANWHALATWAGRAVPDGPSILIDVGSTTTDIIPLVDGFPVPSATSDCGRLQSGELIYTGARRTPLCALTDSIDVDSIPHGVAAELFATTADVHVVRGDLEEQPDSTDTADGRPLTRENSLGRIARMVCCDRSELPTRSIAAMADSFAESQLSRISAGLVRVSIRLKERLVELDRPDAEDRPLVIISGSGSFLAIAAADRVELSDRLELTACGHSGVAESACAYAISRLVCERCRDDLLETVTL